MVLFWCKFGGGPEMEKLFHALYNVDYSLEYGTVPGKFFNLRNIWSILLGCWITCLYCDVSIGGGVALLRASKELDKLQTTKSGQKIGVQLLQKSLKVFVFLFQIFTSSDLAIYERSCSMCLNFDLSLNQICLAKQ